MKFEDDTWNRLKILNGPRTDPCETSYFFKKFHLEILQAHNLIVCYKEYTQMIFTKAFNMLKKSYLIM